ncbi:MAG: acyl-CoA dehydrogenase family protein [Alphaproteobacteria bacterium]|nr:acyl-CoA dehydrogenase family protein [Alphaproteobacteria bacterium]
MEILIEDHQMLLDSATGYLAKKQNVAAFRALRDADEPLGYDVAAYKQMADLGWMGLVLPEEHGGSDFGYRAAGLIAEQMGRNLTAMPFVSTAILSVTILREVGGEMLSEWGMKIAMGECVVALAIDEGVKHRPEQIKTQAVRDGDGYLLSGDKTFIADGMGADRLIVSAMLEGELALFWLDPLEACFGTSCCDLAPQRLLDHRNYANFHIKNCRLNENALIAKGELAERALTKALCVARVVVAAEQLGMAKECAARTVEYLNTRKQFGVLIGVFQTLQHRMAHLYCELEQTSSLVAQALNAIDENAETAEKLSRAAKAKVAKLGRLATEEAVQMHGGIGMTDELDLGLFMKRDRVLAEFLGDANCHIDWLLREQNI